MKSPARTIDLAFDEDVSQALQLMEKDQTTEIMTLIKAAKIIRKEVLGAKYTFNGSFQGQEDITTTPRKLLYFVQMLLDGPKINRGNLDESQSASQSASAAAITVCEIIKYNSAKCRSANLDSIPRHIRDRESPLMIYIAIKLWCSTRKESVVDAMHQRGLCISYKRLFSISIDLANSVIAFFKAIGAVVPPQAGKGVFTVMGYDNYDADPSSTTSMKSSTHGTALSIHQLPYQNMKVLE